jgi:transmembrane sensor
MDQNRIWKLMARKLAGEADDSELQELQGYLGANPEWQFSYDMMQAYWLTHPDVTLSEWEVEMAVDRITGRDDFELEVFTDPVPGRRSRIRRRIVAGSLSVLAISGIALWWMLHLPVGAVSNARQFALGNRAESNRVETKMGTRSRLVLPDGTTVWLNAGSVLTYPSSFYSPNREVTLDGEAFFDVVKDPVHPFIVHASTMNIKVLGTSFNVKAYDKDKIMEATLIKGAVEVSRRDAPNAPRIMLRPNEKLIFHALPPAKNVETIPVFPSVSNVEVTTLKPYKGSDDLIETAWVHNRLEFRGDSFEELASKMERWYNVRISFSDADMKQDKQFRFTGSFEKETVTQALDELKLTARFNYQTDSNDITILP